MKFSHIDLALVVYYRPWPLTMFRSRKLFRFVGRPTPDLKGTIYDKQPAGDMEKDFDSLIAPHDE
jgi:hypothetical protein